MQNLKTFTQLVRRDTYTLNWTVSSNTISYFVTGLLLCTPFGFVWYLLFRLIRQDLRTTLSFSFLIFCTLIAIVAYCGLCMVVCSKVGGQFGDLAMGVAYAAGMTTSFLLLPSLVITIIFFILYWTKRKTDTRT